MKEQAKKALSVRKIAIIIAVIIGIAAFFGVFLLSVITLGDLMRPYVGDFSYLVSLIASIIAVNIICCKIIKPVCRVTFRDTSSGDK